MSEALKAVLSMNDSLEHVQEFGECIGIVEGPTDFNPCHPGEDGYDLNKLGPEVDVRWLPSNLRYAYHPKYLVQVFSK